MADLLDSYSETNVDSDAFIDAPYPTDTGVQWSGFGTSFKTPAGTPYLITSFKAWLKKVGTPTGNTIPRLYVAIDTSQYNSYPAGGKTPTVLASAPAFDASTTLTTSYVLYEFTFATPYLSTPGTVYVLGFEGGAGLTANVNRIAWGGKSATTGARYAGDTNGWTSGDQRRAFYAYGTAQNTGGGFLLNFAQ